MESKELMGLVVQAADSKRAEDTVVLDVSKVSLLADYFVITTGNNERQIQAIVDAIEEKYEASGNRVKRMEGQEKSGWVLMDMGDVIVHVFKPEERAFYHLEKLWKDAPMVTISEWLVENE